MSTTTYLFTFSYPEASLAVTEVNNEAPGQMLQSTLFMLDLIDKSAIKSLGRCVCDNNRYFGWRIYYYGTRMKYFGWRIIITGREYIGQPS